MPSFDVSRSIHIEAFPDAVFADVRNFRKWPDWSPWLICDPHAKLTYADDGKRYDWEGPVCGSGIMRITGESEGSSIDYALTFLSPWKSENTVGFRFAEKDGGTEVTWTMTGSLPWFMFWMKSMMSGYIGADYDRGLRMLKDRIETGSVPSKLEFPGIVELPETAYAGINTECPIDEIGPHMRENFAQIREWLEEADLSPSGPPFCSVLKWSPAANVCRYTACVPFLQAPDEGPAGFVSGSRPACRAYQVRHTGAYRHLGNAWAAGMMHARSKVFHGSKRLAPFETYESDPETTPEDELVTIIHIPAK
ncbi:ligand-binding SRPBCC domain-containing protein [Haloferula helveola]|uniref:Ligand-binding SRPBCC domain-containing protein n=1 Tax=Haloferula helveola TaxID=490095 RepID=A0ABN6H576_9BACT|nr:ligand-binding SRPBCC domain-containing protein [Haloferula helveola]